jgi:hypothetical protein
LNGTARFQYCGALVKGEQQLLALVYERQRSRTWIDRLYLTIYGFRFFNEPLWWTLPHRAKRAAKPKPVHHEARYSERYKDNR